MGKDVMLRMCINKELFVRWELFMRIDVKVIINWNTVLDKLWL